MPHKNLFNGEVDLIILAYTFLCQKARRTHKGFNIVDIFYACEYILQAIERRCLKNKKFIEKNIV